jgi:hypothetical protein
MPEIVGNWLHFDGRQPKRKRAELVCSACHSKKVRCDLQNRSRDGHNSCSNCHTAGKECQIRRSRRKKNLTQEIPRDGPPTSPSSADDTGLEVLPLPLPPPTQASPPSLEPQLPQPSLTESPQSQRTTDLLNGAATVRSNPGDVDTGFLQVYGPENQIDAEQQELEATLEFTEKSSDAQHQELQQIFAETYIEYCYTWCPVLDIDRIRDDAVRSPLLANALALVGSHIRPPLIPHDGPAAYYKKAISIFYNDEEIDGLTTLQAISLFYWWAPRPPTIARRHSSWWWTSVLIRHAQQMNFHREPAPDHPLRETLKLGLRRRIWWTGFARERLTALCQSKPCIIDPEDCNIQEPTLADFPNDPKMQRKGEIFIYWVRLCDIIGKIAKTLSRSGASMYSESAPSAAFPTHLRQALVDWVRSIPDHLQLPIRSSRTEFFDRDIHQLYLPYLTTIIILHLRRSSQDLPQALPPAILAASCIARILRDILSRGDARFLMAITCWYSGTAFIALLQASRIENLAKDANNGLDILTNAVEQLQQMWGSANVIRQGFSRLRRSGGPVMNENTIGLGAIDGALPLHPIGSKQATDSHVFLDNETAHNSSDLAQEDFNWTALFPFVTRSTSAISEALLSGSEPGRVTRFTSPENMLFQETFITDYQGLLEPFVQYGSFDFDDIRLAM